VTERFVSLWHADVIKFKISTDLNELHRFKKVAFPLAIEVRRAFLSTKHVSSAHVYQLLLIGNNVKPINAKPYSWFFLTNEFSKGKKAGVQKNLKMCPILWYRLHWKILPCLSVISI
jgi:hypothetical protein